MKYIKQFAIIAAITFLGEVLNYLLPLPVPASIYGMVLLFVCLKTGIIKLSQIEDTANLLLGIMPIFFISPTVGIMDSFGLIKNDLLGILVLCIVSMLTMTSCGEKSPINKHNYGDWTISATEDRARQKRR